MKCNSLKLLDKGLLIPLICVIQEPKGQILVHLLTISACKLILLISISNKYGQSSYWYNKKSDIHIQPSITKSYERTCPFIRSFWITNFHVLSIMKKNPRKQARKPQEKQIKETKTWVKVLQNHQSVNMVPNSHFHRHKTLQLFRNRYSNLHISSVEMCFWYFNTDIHDAKRNNKNSGFVLK